MSEHPGDSAINRFRAFWAGLLAFVSFGVVLWIALNAAGSKVVVEPGWAERGEVRASNLAEVQAAQAAVVAQEAIDNAIDGTITSLKAKKTAKSGLVVPGSPTFLKQAQQSAEPAAEVAPPAPAAEEKPAAPAPTEKKADAPAPAAPAPAEEKADVPAPAPAAK